MSGLQGKSANARLVGLLLHMKLELKISRLLLLLLLQGSVVVVSLAQSSSSSSNNNRITSNNSCLISPTINSMAVLNVWKERMAGVTKPHIIE